MTPRLLLQFLLAFAAFPLAGAEPPPTPATTSPVEQPAAGETAAPVSTTSKSGVSLDDIRSFTAVFNLVKQTYVDEVDDHRLMQAAVRGMLSDLDPHSQYLGREQLEDLSEDTSGAYNGLGIEVMQVQGSLRVVAPIDGSPAQQAGIRSGDTIVSIDGKPVQPDDLDGAVAMLRGAVGSKVTLGILREGQGEPFDLEILRGVVRVASVRARLLEPGYAYLRISQFQAETGSQLRRSIGRLQADGKNTLRGAVLDLRSNPGGLLNSAVEVSNEFLDRGVIVTTRGRTPDSVMSFSASPGGDLLRGAPLVVLIDGGTASAAEIVAGALKDNRRALLVGQRSFGKGSVQTVLPLDAEHAVKLTTARYYTPNGTSIQAAGIEPDIALADLMLSPRDGAPIPMLGERDLRNHLRGSGEDDAADRRARPSSDDTEQDYALSEALNVLKALALRAAPPSQG